MNIFKKIINAIAVLLFGKVVWNLVGKKPVDCDKQDSQPEPEPIPDKKEDVVQEEKPVESTPFILNTSEGKVNYSQRKSQFVHVQKGQYGENKIDWTSLCNSHALIMAFLYAGWACPPSSYEREPDAFADFVVKECLKEDNWFKSKMYNLWDQWYNGQPDAYSPLELHDVLAHYACEWFKSDKADKFNAGTNLIDVFCQLYENKIAVPTSVQWCKLAGHVVTMVGFKAPTETSVQDWLNGTLKDCPVTHVILDDPWGFPIPEENRYDKNRSGNDVTISFDIFMKAWKPVNDPNKKFAHFIGRPASYV